MRKYFVFGLLMLCLTLAGCGDTLLERSYSSVVPHSAAYWENEDADTLRAENYQDVVNALLILLGEHSGDGVVRIYGDAANKSAMAGDACVEVQKETPIGAYLLDYITYEGKAESAYYELRVRFGYRRTAEEQSAIVNATSTEALPDLLRAAIREGKRAVAIRVGYLGTDREGVMELVKAVHDEVFPPEEPPAEPAEPWEETGEETGGETGGETGEPAGTPPEPQEGESAETLAVPQGEAGTTEEGEPEPPDGDAEGAPEPEGPACDVSPWQVIFYPDDSRPGIVEVILRENSFQ